MPNLVVLGRGICFRVDTPATKGDRQHRPQFFWTLHIAPKFCVVINLGERKFFAPRPRGGGVSGQHFCSLNADARELSAAANLGVLK